MLLYDFICAYFLVCYSLITLILLVTLCFHNFCFVCRLIVIELGSLLAVSLSIALLFVGFTGYGCYMLSFKIC
ncbi:hypothetical protein HanXRQr2_Chr10g0425671 [Helianthus annuus]|uniref:Uncharacterized protein n=1 Tax=Helianthus annuus TaxID=4232 RepID=A0A9K3HVB1_HELAN|nr:hypothetical protein HanXRQr2_Chr10g0425671 [Helianthus annuus]